MKPLEGQIVEVAPNRDRGLVKLFDSQRAYLILQRHCRLPLRVGIQLRFELGSCISGTCAVRARPLFETSEPNPTA
jgi:hypothetical protein